MIIYFLSSSDLCTQRQPARVIWALLGKDQARPAVVVNYQVSTNFSCNQHKSGADLKSKSSLKAERRHFQRSLWMIIYNQQGQDYEARKKMPRGESRGGTVESETIRGKKNYFRREQQKGIFYSPNGELLLFLSQRESLNAGQIFSIFRDDSELFSSDCYLLERATFPFQSSGCKKTLIELDGSTHVFSHPTKAPMSLCWRISLGFCFHFSHSSSTYEGIKKLATRGEDE